jgi:MFS family permease
MVASGACSALLALGAWTNVINTNSVLACIFALGIGIAFGAPVWGAIVPDTVSKEELPSAVTLGGVQLNLSGIVGPALGGLLLPLLGAPLLISINVLTFLVVALVVSQWKPRQMKSTRLRENFGESFINSLRYALNSSRMKTILFRNLLFSLVISVVPALLPVIALKELHLSAAQLGLVFTCVGLGSLAGAMIALFSAAVLALAGLALGHRFSINFATEASVDAAPLNPLHDFPVSPQHEDGPITVTIEYAIASEDRERFRNFDGRSSGGMPAQRRVPVPA